MGSKSNALAQSTSDIIYQATAKANWWDNAASSPATNVYISLHTAWPGKAGTQATSEIANAGYARKAVARSSSGWSRTGQVTSNNGAQTFATITGGSPTKARFWATGEAASGSTAYFHSGAIGGPRVAFTAVAGASDVLTIPGHSFVTTTGLNEIVFWSSPGATLPSNIVEGTVYFVKTVSGNDITISATDGGAQFDTGNAGSGFAQNVSGIAIDINSTPTLANGAIQITES